jgi:hypothetical protein
MNRLIMLFALIIASSGTWPAALCRADFDREACERACRSRYMGPGVFKSGDSGHQLMSLDSCIQECERQFWEDFEKKTSDKEKNDWDRRGR